MIISCYFLIFVFGAVIGSFLGVIVDRMNSGEAIWKGRSHCDHCRHKLHTLDLIPILSFFVLQQQCRYCHKSLSWSYPVIEIATGVCFVFAAFRIFQLSWSHIADAQTSLLMLYYFALIGALIAIFFTDLKYGIIPFKLVAFALGITILWKIFLPAFSPTDFLLTIASALGSSLFFFALFYFTKGRGMGFGDVIYAFLMGFVLGFPNVLLGLYIAFISGAIVSLVLIIMKKKQFHGGTIPFGPFLVIGTIISLLWGNSLINYIMSYLLR